MGQAPSSSKKKKSDHIFVEVGGPNNDPNDPVNQADPFFFLATEIIMKILKYLNRNELGMVACVSKRWRACAYDPYLWNTFEALLKQPWTIDDTKILGLVCSQNSISIWNFKGCEKITSKAIQFLVDYCVQIASLDLFGCKKIDDNALIYVANSKHAETLHTFYLSWLPLVTSKGMCAIAQNCKNLKNLSLFGTKIKDFHSFFPYLSRLESLNVGNTLNPVPQTYEAIAKYCPNISCLQFKSNETEGISLVLESLNTKLTHLEIPTARLTEQILRNMLKFCPNIEHLNISSIPISYLEWERTPLSKEIAKVLEGYHSTLKSLHLLDNYFLTASDTESILQYCTQLEELRISTRFGSVVLKCIQKHTNKLKHLQMPGAYVIDSQRRDFRMFFPDAIIEF